MKSLLVAIVLLAPVFPGRAHDLLWKPRVGQRLTYALKLEGQMSGGSFTMTSGVILSVKKVHPNGDYTLGTTFKGMVADFFGEEQKMPDEPEEIQRFNVRGDLIDPAKPSGNDDEDDVVGELMSRAGEYVPPLKPVEVGESWKHEFAADKKKVLPRAVGTYSLMSDSEGKLKVSIDYLEQAGSEPTRAKGVAIIDETNGSLVSVESEIKNLRFHEGMPSGAAKLSMRRK